MPERTVVIGWPVDREAVARAGAPEWACCMSCYERECPCEQAMSNADAIIKLCTSEVDEERMADAAYEGMQACNSDGRGRGAFLACWSNCSRAVLAAAGLKVEKVNEPRTLPAVAILDEADA